MKRLAIIAATAIALTAGMASSASAAPVHLGCYTGPHHIVPTIKPRSCGFYKDSVNYARPVGYRTITHLRWSHWGRLDARGTGVVEGRRRRVWASMPDGFSTYNGRLDHCCRAFGMLVIPGLSVHDRPLVEMALPYGFDLWPMY